MKLKLDFSFPNIPLKIDYSSPIISLGSCFSDEISKKLQFAGFNVNDNPFGVLFHPLAILNVLNSSLLESKDVAVFKREDLFFSWDASSKVYAMSEDTIREKVVSIREELHQSILEAKVIVLTFGSSFQYSIEKSGIVGNCHKAPQSVFEKKMSTVEEMYLPWFSLIQKVKEINPKIQFLLTVSPVRHVKDGLVENNRSKSRLIELTHQLVESFDDVYYYPSYEIMMDELRDYRFFANDLVHPNQKAVDYIWEHFKSKTMDVELYDLVGKVEKLKKSFLHRSLHPDSEATRLFQIKLEEQKLELMRENKDINWSKNTEGKSF